MWWMMGLLACGLGSSQGRPVAVEVVRGDGYALRATEGARVVTRESGLSVDSADGRSWFDVGWIDTPVNPIVTATTWGDSQCLPMRWDSPVVPTEGTWMVTGLCSIEHRRFWAMLMLENHGERSVLTTFLANRDGTPLEDAWVRFVVEALSVGAEPIQTIDEKTLRARLREVAHTGDHQTGYPVAGGGVLSQSFASAIPEVWAARKTAAPLSERYTR